MGFQRTINNQPAPAVEGDFASQNPRTMVLAGEGALITAPEGVRVGAFAWVGNDGVTVYSRNVSGNKPDGFVANETQASIDFGAQSSMLIPGGRPINLFNGGDFWDKVTGSTDATRSAAVYANNENGDALIGAAPAGSTGTGSIGSTSTGTVDGTDATLITLATLTGYVSIGDTISGTGVPAGTTVIQQMTGTTGAAGQYKLSGAVTSSGVTVTTFGDTLHVTAVTGSFDPGDVVSGTGVPAGSAILSQLSGTTGQAGNYKLDARATAYAASTALTVAAGVLTNFVVGLPAAVGELFVLTTGGI